MNSGYLLMIAAVVVIFAWQSISSKRRRQAKMWGEIRGQWGGPTECEYTADEFQRIASYYNRHKGEGEFIDDITWSDLDMDSMFLVMDRTFSFIGEEYLYYFLRTPVRDQEILNERERLFAHFDEDDRARESLQEIYYQMGKNKWRSLSESIYRFGGVTAPNILRHYLQAVGFFIALLSIFLVPQVGIILTVIMLMVNIATYYQEKAQIEPYIDAIGQISRLLHCSEEVVKLADPQLADYTSRLSKANRDLKNFRRKAWRIRTGNGMSGSISDAMMDYVRMVFHTDLIAFGQVAGIVRDNWKAVEELMAVLGYLESCIAVASFRRWLPYYSIPQFCGNEKLIYEAEDLYHPLLTEPVANSILEDGCVLLTGSNASGKSTFLKTVALNVLLAQTVNTAIASSYRANFYRLYTSMALRDDICAGDSYYMVEIKALKRILDAVNPTAPVLCCVDEVLRGTNTVERIAASTKILERISCENVKCFAATHDLELTNLLEGRYHNYHFREEMEDDDIVFHYLLHKGPATTRNAIRLLSILGYRSDIIAEAEEMANHFLESGKWE